jgi:peptide/nickel transport system ATP-binding protein
VSLKVEDLRIAYKTLGGDVRAVDGVSFSIDDQEIMGLAGESGCGKSTLGNSLVFMEGRMKQVGGSVELDGKPLPIGDTRAMNQYRMRAVSIIPQYAMSALNPTKKIGTLASDLLKSRGVRVNTVLEEMKRRIALVGLPENVLGMYPFELSGGMRQRTTMVLSTLLNPSLLVADEVTSALDVSTQRAVGEMLMEFRERGFVKSMIVITHDLSILSQIADSILVMYAGKLAEKADAGAVVDRPLHPYTQRLLGSLPEVGLRYEDAALVGIPGRPPSLLHPPAGCRFRERCPFAFEKCAEEPPFVELQEGHQVACWKAMQDVAQKAAGQAQRATPPGPNVQEAGVEQAPVQHVPNRQADKDETAVEGGAGEQAPPLEAAIENGTVAVREAVVQKAAP